MVPDTVPNQNKPFECRTLLLGVLSPYALPKTAIRLSTYLSERQPRVWEPFGGDLPLA